MHVTATNLSLDRGNRRIVSDLSFTVNAGEALVLTGPNGAGKTTLIRAIAGFLPPAAGAIRLEGGPPDAEIAEQCHLVGHRDGVKGALTVAENAAFYARYLGSSLDLSSPLVGEVPRRGGGGVSATAAREATPPPALVEMPAAAGRATSPARGEISLALDRLGIGALADVPAAYLSAGQRRRVGLSRLLLARRPLWLLDEPTVSLDAEAVATLAGIVAEHLAGGGLLVAATHIPLGLEQARELRLGA